MGMVDLHSLLATHAALHSAASRVVSRHDLGALAKRGDSLCIESLRVALAASRVDGGKDLEDSITMAGYGGLAARLGFSLLKEEYVRDKDDGALDRLLMRVYLLGMSEGKKSTATIEATQAPPNAQHNEQSGGLGDAR